MKRALISIGGGCAALVFVVGMFELGRCAPLWAANALIIAAVFVAGAIFTCAAISEPR